MYIYVYIYRYIYTKRGTGKGAKGIWGEGGADGLTGQCVLGAQAWCQGRELAKSTPRIWRTCTWRFGLLLGSRIRTQTPGVPQPFKLNQTLLKP